MESFREFDKEPSKNWFKPIVALRRLQKQLEPFIDKEMVIFHRELVKECGANPCEKKCSFNDWKPQQTEIPPLGCELCSSWRDSILANHTNPKGKVTWKNSKPDRWSQDKWEVAKVYMPGGHEKHNSIGDFDIAALLCLMSQCKHFKKFKLHQGLCQNVSEVRNNIMHSATFQLKQKDFLNYFNRIRKFGEVLEKRDPEFESLSKEINENLVFPDDMAAQKIRAQNEKEREDIIFGLTTHATAFVRAKHCLSQKDMSDIDAGAQQYQSSLFDNLRKQMEGVLKKHSGNTSGQLKKDAMGIFDNFLDPFASVATTFKQNTVLKKQISCLDAEEISNARTICRKKHGESKDFFIKNKVFHYVPLVKSPEQFLSHPRILSMIEKKPQKCREGFFQDIIDGALLKSHPLFLEKPNPLQIVLYMNEIDICNPLGSFASKNKLLMVYFLGNRNPKYRSKLAAIRPLGTLAQHELAVFKEGEGFAYSKCRHYECSFEYMQSHFNEDAYTKRTLENTDLLRNSLDQYRINRRRKLVEFPAFDIVQPTPQDIMHVILGGIAPLEIKCVLNHLIHSGRIYLDSVNSAVLGFPYSPLGVRDRPSPISVTTLMSSDGKLKQSSVQMLVPLRILPFVLESLEVKAYVQLIIEQIVFAPVLTIATVSRLKLLIENHLKLWKELFPDHNVTPKKHYMIDLENICKCLINQNQIYESCQHVDTSMHPISLNEREMGPVSEVKDLQYLRGKLRDFLGFNE